MAIKPKIGIKCFSIMMFISIACFLTVFAHVLLTHVKHDLRKVRNVKTSAEVNIEQIVKVVEHVMKNIGGFFPQQIRKKNDTRSS
jgi:hypothetical protein